MALSTLVRMEAIIKTSSNKQVKSPIDHETNPLGHLTNKIKFINTSEVEPHESHFLSEAVNFLGILNKGNLDLWEYLIRRFNKISGTMSPELICNFVEGKKIFFKLN